MAKSEVAKRGLGGGVLELGHPPLLSLFLLSLLSSFFPLSLPHILDWRACSQAGIVVPLEIRNEDWESFLNGKGHNLGQGLLRRLVKCAKNVKFPFNKIIMTKLLNLEAGEKTIGSKKT